MPALSVIIPTFNVERCMQRTLESVDAAVRYLEKHAPKAGAELIVVDDASTDATAAIVRAFAERHPYVRALSNPENQGASVGRNRGAYAAQGSILCFFDADDVMLERHLFVAYDVLDRFPQAHAAQMKIRIDETLHPEWRKSIEDSVVFNKAVRRDVHNFIGGFLESPLFKILPCEDVFYCQMLTAFFQVGYVDEATVHHFRYPGNALDRQIEKFTRPPGAGPESERPAERETAPKVYALFEARMAELRAKQDQARATPTQEPLNILLDRALQHYREKAWKQAEDACREALARDPNLFEPIYWLGRIYESQGKVKEAVATYDEAIAKHPGYGGPFSRRAMTLVRRNWGEPPPLAAPTGAAKKITNTRIGLDGRWANQLLQYAFLRMYAQEFGLAVEVPDWIGRDVYEFNDPWPSGGYGVLEESQLDLAASLTRRIPQVAVNADMRGFFCYHTSNFAKYRPLLQSLFVPARKAGAAAEKSWKKIAKKGRTVVVVHLRRGDFGWGKFWIAPADWYRTWLKEIWPTLEKPVLYVATDDAKTLSELKEFKPLAAKDLGKPIPGLEFFYDFHMLTQAHVVATSNSTFSVFASMLNTRAKTFMRPDRSKQQLVPFDPWSTDILQE